jgi:hypothetical protein
MKMNRNAVQPRQPAQISPYAEACLRALVAGGLNDRLSLGGAFGLLHYLDYRATHDIDAWWNPSATSAERAQVVRVLEEVLHACGEVRTRSWGDVVSIELVQGGKTVFSFQVALRSVQLEPSVPTPWIGVPLDSFPDLVASKMVALVERGAPRDFRDIYALCQSGLTTTQECWRLWRRRQQLANSDADVQRARLAIETHLTRIALHRPLDEITDPEQKTGAQQLRTWFKEEFLHALVD